MLKLMLHSKSTVFSKLFLRLLMASIKKPEKKSANLSLRDMELAIPRIERRLADLEKFDPSSVNDRGDPQIDSLSQQLDSLLVSIFGPDTVEYDRYHWGVTRLDTASINMYHRTAIEDVREGLRRGISTAKAQLESIKK